MEGMLTYKLESALLEATETTPWPSELVMSAVVPPETSSTANELSGQAELLLPKFPLKM